MSAASAAFLSLVAAASLHPHYPGLLQRRLHPDPVPSDSHAGSNSAPPHRRLANRLLAAQTRRRRPSPPVISSQLSAPTCRTWFCWRPYFLSSGSGYSPCLKSCRWMMQGSTGWMDGRSGQQWKSQ